MSIEPNQVYNLDNRDGLPKLPERCANLIISDPPYFECKGDFDFVWQSFDEYLDFMEYQARLYKRVLADNGTLFVYGHAKRIAYVQVIFDKYFNLENNIVIKFLDRQTNKGLDNFRCFSPITDRLLMYSNEIDMTGLEYIDEIFVRPRNPFRKEINSARLKVNISTIQVAEMGKFYGNVNHGGSVANWENGDNIPTSEQYDKLKGIIPLDKEYETLRQEYETLRQEYDTFRRPFNNVMRLSDVMEFSQEAHITSQYDHETQKPEKLTRALIVTCSRENDLVVVPFVGSGTECAMAVRENRRFIGFETNPKHCATATMRIKKEIEKRQQQDMFVPPKSNGKLETKTMELF